MAWLSQNQNDDGSWGDALSLLETSTALSQIDADLFQNDGTRERALAWLNASDIRNNDDLSRIFAVPENRTEANASALLGRQNPDGGWGLTERHTSNALDTVLALEPLIVFAPSYSACLRKAADYLIAIQSGDGSWGYVSDGPPSVYLTAHALMVLLELRNKAGLGGEGLEIAVAAAQRYVRGITGVGPGFDPDFGKETFKADIYAFLAMATTQPMQDNERLTNRLAAVQRQDGSFHGSCELTALAVRLLSSAEGWVNEPGFQNGIIIGMGTYAYSDGELVGASEVGPYTDIHFVPALRDHDEAAIDCLYVIKDHSSRLIPLSGSPNAAWNTANNPPGGYEAYLIIRDKTTGQTMDIASTAFRILEGSNVKNASLAISPAYWRLGSYGLIKATVYITNESNVPRPLTVMYTLLSPSGDSVAQLTQVAFCEPTGPITALPPVYLAPNATEVGQFPLSVTISDETGTILTCGGTLDILPLAPNTGVEIGYTLSKPILLPGADKVDLTFAVDGVGNTEALSRLPIDLVLCLDDSGSMDGDPWEQTKAAAVRIVGLLQPVDRCAVNLFNHGTFMSLASDKGALASVIRNLPNSGGATPMDDSINAAIRMLRESPSDRQRVMMVLSDGEPRVYEWAVDAVHAAVAEGITVHTLGLGDGVNREFMQLLADIGGGAFIFSPTPDQLIDMMQEMAGEIFDVSANSAELSLTVPTDAFPAGGIAFTPPPNESTVNADGSISLKWVYPKIILGEELSAGINYDGDSLEKGAVVTLARDIVLMYVDKAGSRVIAALDPITIPVGSQRIDSRLTTDKVGYVAGDTVWITLTAQNLTYPRVSPIGKLEIIDGDGAVVALLADGIDIPGDGPTSQSHQWETGGSMAGSYGALLSWFVDGEPTHETIARFDVLSTGSLTNRLTTDKTEYRADETAEINDRIFNGYANHSPGSVTDRITVQDGGGAMVFSREVPVGSILSSVRDVKVSWDIGNLPAGEYTVRAVVSEGGVEVSNDRTTVTVTSAAQDGTVQPVRGLLTVQPKTVVADRTFTVISSLTNAGPDDLYDVVTEISVIDPRTLETVVWIQNHLDYVGADRTVTHSHDISTAGYGLGGYLLLYSANIGEDTVQLQGSGIEVVEEDIPAVTLTPTPSATPTTVPTPSSEPTPSSGPTPSSEPTPPSEPTPSSEPTPPYKPSPTTAPTPTSPNEPTPTTPSAPTPSQTPSPTLESQKTIEPTPSPIPSPMEAPTPAYHPDGLGYENGHATPDPDNESGQLYEPVPLSKPGLAIECIDIETSEVIYSTAQLNQGSSYHVFAPKLAGWLLVDETEYRLTGGVPNETVRFHYSRDESGIHHQYIFGYPDGLMRPDGHVTRAETAALLFNLIRDGAKAGFEASGRRFADVPASHWAAKHIEYITMVGLASGYPDGLFRPDAGMTREEFTGIVYVYANLEPNEAKRTNVDSWSEPFIDNLYSNGFLTGYPNGDLGIKDYLTRAQAISILNRVLNRKADVDAIPIPGAHGLADVPDNHWAFADFAEAASTHGYKRANGAEAWRLNREMTE